MLKSISFILIILTFCTHGLAQDSLNNYKYILVPSKYDFLSQPDQFRLNALTKFLFNKYGYEAYFVKDKYPEDLERNRCLALKAEVVEVKGSIFKNKLQILLKDCYDRVVISSKEGSSRLKKLEKAYNEALRDAFETFQYFNYSYNPAPATDNLNVQEQAMASEMAIIAKSANEPKVLDQSQKTQAEVPSKELVIAEVVAPAALEDDVESIYYAQRTDAGYQLVNTEPRVVMVLYRTSAEDLFIVKGKQAVVYKKDDKWIYSENDGTTAIEKGLNIKF